MKLIDKDALVAEIDKCYNISSKMVKVVDADYWNGKADAYRCVLTLLDALEVKGVDVIEELDYDDYIDFFKEHPEYNNGNWGFEETWTFGQYCYTLGLKALKGEEV